MRIDSNKVFQVFHGIADKLFPLPKLALPLGCFNHCLVLLYLCYSGFKVGRQAMRRSYGYQVSYHNNAINKRESETVAVASA